MREIPLTQGFVALVDDADYNVLMQWTWRARRVRGFRYVYAARSIQVAGQQQIVFMHNEIMQPPPGFQADHIDHNTLDNRRPNLRLCTHAANLHNQTKQAGTSSRFLGVCWHKAASKWHVQIKLDGRGTNLGLFTNEQDAARAYDQAVIAYRDQYATTNFSREEAVA